MADVSIANLPPFVGASIAGAALGVMVDTADSSESPLGTTKRFTYAQLFNNPPITNLTVTNLTVTGTTNLQGPVTLNSTLTVAGVTTIGPGDLIVTNPAQASIWLKKTNAPAQDVYLFNDGTTFGLRDVTNSRNPFTIALATQVASFASSVIAAGVSIGGGPVGTQFDLMFAAGVGGSLQTYASLPLRLNPGGNPVTVGPSGLTTSGTLTVTGGSFASGSMYKDINYGLVLSGVAGAINDFSVFTPNGVTAVLRIPTGTPNVIFGGQITPGQLSAFSPAVIGTYGPYGLYLQGKTGSSYDFAVGNPASSGLVMYNPTGTFNMVFSGAVAVNGVLTLATYGGGDHAVGAGPVNSGGAGFRMLVVPN